VPSAHSQLVLGRVPFPGDIADCADIPIRAGAYRCGAVFSVEIRVAGRVVYHMGSAELVDANSYVKNVDLLLLCVAGWTASRGLPERVGQRLAPGAALLSHLGQLLAPNVRTVRSLPAMQMPRLVERLSRAVGGVKVGRLPRLGEVWL
jgi:hypothetical protein